jgi:hypothetical protein
VSIRQSATGLYWDGSAYTSRAEAYLVTSLSGQSAASLHWSYALPRPAPDGTYILHVRATDTLGNVSPVASPTASTFAIDTTPPPAPSITSQPANTTDETTATFTFTDSDAGASFLCRRDSGSFSACTSPKTYTGLSLGTHSFSVEARDAVGNVSDPTSYSWTIEQTAGLSFAISGNAPSPLYPGAAAEPLAITLTNPNHSTIYVTALSAAVQSTSASGCLTSWFQMGPASIPAGGIAVPAGGSATVPAAEAPMIRMIDSGTNQDVCKNAGLTLAYTGSAHS